MPDPATLVVTRIVRPGHLDRFRAWVDDYDAAAAHASGDAGSVRLEQAGGFHHLLHRFASEDDLVGWLASPDHAALIARGRSHAVGRAQRRIGDRVRFDVPSDADAHSWKTWLVTWVAVLPVLLLVSSAIRALLPGLPPIAQTIVSSPFLTAILTFIILPRVNRWSRFWQMQDAAGRVRSAGDGG